MGGAYNALTQAIEFPIENMISLGHLMFSGILDRFPKLRVSVLESNCGWMPFWLSRLDKCSSGRHSVFFDAEPIMSMPSEYFQRQCFVACDADESGIKFCIEQLGDDNIVFNTDYPHADAPDPDKPVPEMIAQPIGDESKKKIFWDNAITLYGQRLIS
jgi:predicted TIM-barrel fold metal-dependent hydrolase